MLNFDSSGGFLRSLSHEGCVTNPLVREEALCDAQVVDDLRDAEERCNYDGTAGTWFGAKRKDEAIHMIVEELKPALVPTSFEEGARSLVAQDRHERIADTRVAGNRIREKRKFLGPTREEKGQTAYLFSPVARLRSCSRVLITSMGVTMTEAVEPAKQLERKEREKGFTMR